MSFEIDYEERETNPKNEFDPGEKKWERKTNSLQ